MSWEKTEGVPMLSLLVKALEYATLLKTKQLVEEARTAHRAAVARARAEGLRMQDVPELDEDAAKEEARRRVEQLLRGETDGS